MGMIRCVKISWYNALPECHSRQSEKELDQEQKGEKGRGVWVREGREERVREGEEALTF